ncbi:MAG: histidine phosphatase family protein [Minicystis sp.]
MRLYVMRHGPAEDRAPTGRDADRALTVPGRDVVDRAARALLEARAAMVQHDGAASGPDPGAVPLRVLSSPYRRAWETAEIVAGVIGDGEPEPHGDLAGDADVPFALVREVRAAGRDVILIGHQPFVEELVRMLVHPARPSLGNGFRTATIAALEDAGERWHLTTVIDPHAGR